MYNLASIVEHNADRNPEKTAIVAGNRRITNAQFSRRVNALSAGLHALGIQRGDVVALLMYNHPEFLESVFAINRVGAVFLPLNYRLSPAEWNYILEDSSTKAIIAEAAFADGVSQALEGLTRVPLRLLIGDDAPVPWEPLERLIRAHDGATRPLVEADARELQRLMYTSGTTSRPKGVMLSHSNVIWKNFSHIIEFGLTEFDSTLICGPLYHVGGLDLPGIGTMHAGGSVVLVEKFDANDVVSTIERERPSNIWLAPAMMNAILQLPDLASRDLSSIRFIIGGGEKMPEPLIEKIVAAFPHAWFSDAYGLTETVSGDTFNDSDHMLEKAGSVGKPVVHLQVQITREDGGPAGPMELGEIALKGPKVFEGYWRNEEATAEAIRDGWFHTGDVGRIDEDGYLYVEDRKKDVIVSGGENIASPEVERVLYENPDVLEAAVVAEPHERWGEVPKAFVVLKHTLGTHDDALRLQEFCRQRLAKFKVPAAIEFVSELPRTPTGKVLKRNLRAADVRGSDHG